jgi:hypothetical protein
MKAYNDNAGNAVFIQQLSKFSGHETPRVQIADFRLTRGNDTITVETSRGKLREVAYNFDQLLIEAKALFKDSAQTF